MRPSASRKEIMMDFLAILKGCSCRFMAIAIAVNHFRLKFLIGIIVGYVASSLAWFTPYPGAWVGRAARDNSGRKTTMDFLAFAIRGCSSRLWPLLPCE